MKKRLRKKKHLGEYRVWGVEIAVTRNRADGFDEFLNAFVDTVELAGAGAAAVVKTINCICVLLWGGLPMIQCLSCETLPTYLRLVLTRIVGRQEICLTFGMTLRDDTISSRYNSVNTFSKALKIEQFSRINVF